MPMDSHEIERLIKEAIPDAQIEIRDLCRRLGKTVMFVTHDLDEAVAIGDRCVVFTGRPGTIDRVVDRTGKPAAEALRRGTRTVVPLAWISVIARPMREEREDSPVPPSWPASPSGLEW